MNVFDIFDDDEEGLYIDTISSVNNELFTKWANTFFEKQLDDYRYHGFSGFSETGEPVLNSDIKDILIPMNIFNQSGFVIKGINFSYEGPEGITLTFHSPLIYNDSSFSLYTVTKDAVDDIKNLTFSKPPSKVYIFGKFENAEVLFDLIDYFKLNERTGL